MENYIFLFGICFLFIGSEFIVNEMKNNGINWPVIILNKYTFTYIIGFLYFGLISYVFVERISASYFIVKAIEYSLVYIIIAVICIIAERKWQASFIKVVALFVLPLIFGGALPLFPVLSKRLVTHESILLIFCICLIIFSIITLTAFKQRMMNTDIVYRQINRVQDLEIVEAHEARTEFYKAVEDFGKLVILFENGVYTADEFKKEKSVWIDELSNQNRPIRVSELLVALLPYLKNNALQEEELARIKKLA